MFLLIILFTFANQKENILYMIHTISFDNIVNAVYRLPVEDRLELKNLLEHNIMNTRRNEILDNYKQANEDYKAGGLKFSSDINELKKML